MNTRRLLLILLTLALVTVGYSLYRVVHRARHNLVTLHLTDVPLRVALARIAGQTRERIVADQKLDTPVTIEVKDTPLEEVLDRLAEQVGALRRTTYSVYDRPSDLERLVASLGRGDDVGAAGWTNLSVGNLPPPPDGIQESSDGRPPLVVSGGPIESDFDVRVTTPGGASAADSSLDSAQEAANPGMVRTMRWVTRDQHGVVRDLDVSPERLLLQGSLASRWQPHDPVPATEVSAQEVARVARAHSATLYTLEAMPFPVSVGGLSHFHRGGPPRQGKPGERGNPGPPDFGNLEADMKKRQYDRLDKLTPEQRARQSTGPSIHLEDR